MMSGKRDDWSYDCISNAGLRIKNKERMSSMAWFRMSCVLWTFYGIALAFPPLVDSIKLPPVHWNSSNPMFKTSNNDHIIEVNLYDRMDFICPHHTDATDSSSHEFYVIYMVSKREYDDCNIYNNPPAIMIVNCSQPKYPKVFTLLFDPFSSIPNVPEYKHGGTYYYITTSTGKEEGISNSHQGACLYKNMKLTIKVCCETTTLPATSNATTLPVPTNSSTIGQGEVVSNGTAVLPPHGGGVNETEAPKPTLPPSTTEQPPEKTVDVKPRPPDVGWKLPTTTVRYTNKPPPDKDKNDDEENETYPKHEELSVNSASSTHHKLSGHVLMWAAVTWTLYHGCCRTV